MTVSSQMHRNAPRAPLEDPRAVPAATGGGRRTPVQARQPAVHLRARPSLPGAGLPVAALAAHPGYAGTHLVANGQLGRSRGGLASILGGANRAVAQSAAAGALPLLMAATDDLPGSTYCGRRGRRGAGLPRVVGCSKPPATSRANAHCGS